MFFLPASAEGFLCWRLFAGQGVNLKLMGYSWERIKTGLAPRCNPVTRIFL
jgi:hypothetical protein